jgi:UDP-N-acetylenolpyruvoylglucosamine reductase
VSAELSYESSAQSIARIIAERGEVASPMTVRAAVLTARGNIGMLRGQYRSAGSFFKNTILDAADFKALEAIIARDHAEVSAKFTPWHWALPAGQVKVSTAFLLECTPYNKTTYGTERINGVGFSPKHSLSIVTEPDATAAAVREFAARVEAAVATQLGVQLEREVIYIEAESLSTKNTTT